MYVYTYLANKADSDSDSRDGVIGFVYCSITVFQNILLSGRTFNKLSVLREISWLKLPFVKVTKDNN